MDFDDTFGLGALGLSFSVRLDGFAGEDFTYSVYCDAAPEDKIEAVKTAVNRFQSKRDDPDIYYGYVGVSLQGNKILIHHDLGNVQPQDIIPAIQELMTDLDSLGGIKEVVINEGMGFPF